MASVKGSGPNPKARSTRRTSPAMPSWSWRVRPCPLFRARIPSKSLMVAQARLPGRTGGSAWATCRPRLSRARSGRRLSRHLPAGATPSRRATLPARAGREGGGSGRRRPSARAAASLDERRLQAGQVQTGQVEAGQVEAEAAAADQGLQEVGRTFHRFGRSAGRAPERCKNRSRPPAPPRSGQRG